MEKRIAARGAARIAYLAGGEGPAVLLLASLGRGAEDFAEVAPLVAAVAARCIAATGGCQPDSQTLASCPGAK